MEIGVIEAPTVRELFIEKIAGMIIDGSLKPGEKLPSERELAAQTHISKSAVHFAMAELERLGFVETSARHGTYVSDYTKKGNIETLKLLTDFNPETFLDHEHMEDMLEMRMAIEGKAVEKLAEKMNEEDEKILMADIEKSEQIVKDGGDVRTLAKSFFDFHHDICFCSGNFILPLLFNSFEYVTVPYWEYAIRSYGTEQCLKLMKELFEVLKKKDGKASAAFLKNEFIVFMER